MVGLKPKGLVQKGSPGNQVSSVGVTVSMESDHVRISSYRHLGKRRGRREPLYRFLHSSGWEAPQSMCVHLCAWPPSPQPPRWSPRASGAAGSRHRAKQVFSTGGPFHPTSLEDWLPGHSVYSFPFSAWRLPTMPGGPPFALGTRY